MTLFSLRWKFYLLCSLLALSAYCEKKPSNRTYNVCRFVREGQRCDYKKFDSSGDEPCVIGRKAGLTRINGVKVRLVVLLNLLKFINLLHYRRCHNLP